MYVEKSQCVSCINDSFDAFSNLITFRCAFVNFKERTSAETAAQAWAAGLDIEGQRVSVRWGRSKASAKPPILSSSSPSPAVATSA